MTTFYIYHVIDGKLIVGENENFHNVDPRRLYHVLNCLKKLGEKTIEVSLNLKKTTQHIVITGKETGVKVVFAPIRIR